MQDPNIIRLNMIHRLLGNVADLLEEVGDDRNIATSDFALDIRDFELHARSLRGRVDRLSIDMYEASMSDAIDNADRMMPSR